VATSSSTVARRGDVAAVLALTLGTGAADAVSYFSLNHVFTANMSGNIALMGIGVVHGLHQVIGNAFSFAGFVCGSVTVGRLLRSGDGSNAQLAARMLSLELGLLVSVACAIAWLKIAANPAQRDAVCVMLAAAMGIQTGVARLLAVSDVNTTVATMTLHDLAAGSRLAGGDSLRWRRRAGVIVALLVGAALGVGLDELTPAGGLVFTCLTVAYAAVAVGGVRQRVPILDET
jgi:uncharacterized membrane protein YoaK (UPF0700 family)